MGLIFWLCVLGVAYVYLGYPAVLAVLARLAQAKAPCEAATPNITLLIAAHNEEAVIAAKIENSLALAYPADKLQIIVAADGSNDNTAAIVQTFAAKGVVLNYEPERRGKAAAINRALPLARGEVIVFSDANNIYDADALRHLLAPFCDRHVGGVSGAKHISSAGNALAESEGLYWKYESFIKSCETALGSCTGVAGEILAVRRELVQPLPDGIINDDFYLAMRVVRRGFRVVYQPQAVSFERVSATAGDEQVRRARIIAGRYQAMGLAASLLPWNNPLVVWQVVSHKFLRPLLPLLMLGALAANLLALALPSIWLPAPMQWLMLALQGLFYASAVLGSVLERQRGIARLLYLPTFLVNSNLAALTGLIKYLTGAQLAVWQRARRDP